MIHPINLRIFTSSGTCSKCLRDAGSGLERARIWGSGMEVKLLSRIRLFATMGYIIHGILQARRLELVAFPFSIFPAQGSNPGLPHCRQILYQLSHQGNPLGWRRQK